MKEKRPTIEAKETYLDEFDALFGKGRIYSVKRDLICGKRDPR